MKAGLNPEIAKALAEGRRPERMSEDEEIIYSLCTELQRNKSVSDATYQRARREVRRTGRHRRDRHPGLLHAARDGDEHGAHAAACRTNPARAVSTVISCAVVSAADRTRRPPDATRSRAIVAVSAVRARRRTRSGSQRPHVDEAGRHLVFNCTS